MLSHLFQPVPELRLQHRIVMAPLTRVRAGPTFACGPTAALYYAERATPGGLLISEGVPISPETQYEYAAGIYTDEQTQAWANVVKAVHAKKGLISAQLWHLGRMCHDKIAENAFLKSLGRPLPSVSCSATKPEGGSRADGTVRLPYNTARALTAEEIEGRLVDDFRQAALNAKKANFDFVEIHAAHGYLFDQFFCDSTNLRTDKYGTKSGEDRFRALGLVLEAVIAVFGTAKRVGIRISPTYKNSFAFQGCKDSNPEETYRDVISRLAKFDLAYLLITEPRWNGGRQNMDAFSDPTFSMQMRGDWVKKIYPGFVIGSSSFTDVDAEKAIKDKHYDAIAFGRFFISNPDFVNRVRNKQSLNVYSTETFYVRDDVKGYVDYPTFENKGDFPQITFAQIGSKVSKL